MERRLLYSIIFAISLSGVITETLADCTLGEPLDPSATNPDTRSGQFFNFDNPAVCSGNLTVWHFCFYNSVASIDQYSLWLRVWRQQGGNRWMKIGESAIRGMAVPQNRSGIVTCEDFNLEERDYIEVVEGDILAVYVPFTVSTVPIVATGVTGSSLSFDTRQTIDIFQGTSIRERDTNREPNIALQLYADIQTPTDIMPSSVIVTVAPTTIPTSFNGTEGEAAAAAVIIILLLIAAAVVAAVVVFFLYKRRQRNAKRNTENNITHSFSITNALYSSAEFPRQNDTSDASPENSHSPHPPVLREPSKISLAERYEMAKSVHPYSVPRPAGSMEGVNSIPDLVLMNDVVNNAIKHSYDVPKAATPEGKAGLSSSGDSAYIYMSGGTSTGRTYSNIGDHRVSEIDEDSEDSFVVIGQSSVIYQKLLNQVVMGDENEESPYSIPPSNEEEIYVELSRQKIKMIPKAAVEVTTHLGSGEFGNVEKGTWHRSRGDVVVAIKTIPSGASENEKLKLLQEAAIMGQFRHPNIVQIYGVIVQEDPFMLLLEYLPKGDLREYLRNLRPDPGQLAPANTPKLLLSFSQQTVLGMHYLSSKGFVHRDLAARNVFLTEDNTCKIGDFGMSRELSEDECFTVARGGKIPVKWTAPEAIHCRRYSTASDVWSYGCLLYEIWSLGQKPFKGLSNAEAIQKLDTGFRLPPPPGCPLMVYQQMIHCWNPSPQSRSSFRAILVSLLAGESKVLAIPTEETSTHELAGTLGASLKAGEDMYKELQKVYLPRVKTRSIYNPDYEYIENLELCDDDEVRI